MVVNGIINTVNEAIGVIMKINEGIIGAISGNYLRERDLGPPQGPEIQDFHGLGDVLHREGS